MSNQNPAGFEVREKKGGTSSLAFSYRVVAKRKDIAAPRLEKVTVPPAPDHTHIRHPEFKHHEPPQGSSRDQAPR